MRSVNMSALTSRGYGNLLEYFQGVTWNDTYDNSIEEHIGWAGNSSEDVVKVSEASDDPLPLSEPRQSLIAPCLGLGARGLKALIFH